MQGSERLSRPRALAESLSIDEATARFAGKWVLLKVSAFDEDRWPARGQVVAHGAEKRVLAVLQQFVSEGQPGPYYLFRAYPRLRTGPEVRQALAEAATHGDPGARGQR